MSKVVNIGLIGAGEVAQNFHLPILNKLPNAYLCALTDRTITKAQNIAQRYNIPYYTTNFDEMLSEESIDAIFITTPTETHYDYVKKSLLAGKHVFIEKPATSTSQELIELRAIAKEKNLKVMIGMNHRFRNDASQLKNFVNNGNMGDILYIKTGWLQKKQGFTWQKKFESLDRGVLLDLGLSLVDSVLWLSDFKEVRSVKATNFHRLSDSYEDFSIAQINFEDGSVGFIECSWAIFSSETNFYCDVFGRMGSSKINPLQLYKSNGDIIKPNSSGDKRTNLHLHIKSYENEIKHFINSVIGFVPVLSTMGEAIKAMKLIEAMYQSAKENKEILVDL